MTRVIHKFEITDWRGTNVMFPMGYVIRHFAWQYPNTRQHGDGGNCFVWVELDKNVPYSVGVRFQIFGTGEEIPDGWQYVGTVQNDGMVWHCYRK